MASSRAPAGRSSLGMTHMFGTQRSAPHAEFHPSRRKHCPRELAGRAHFIALKHAPHVCGSIAKCLFSTSASILCWQYMIQMNNMLHEKQACCNKWMKLDQASLNNVLAPFNASRIGSHLGGTRGPSVRRATRVLIVLIIWTEACRDRDCVRGLSTFDATFRAHCRRAISLIARSDPECPYTHDDAGERYQTGEQRST